MAQITTARESGTGWKTRVLDNELKQPGGVVMAATKRKTQKKRKVGKVMHEYKKGSLKSGPGGKGGKVKNRKQAIAIAMSESGQSRKKSTRKSTGRKSTGRKSTARKSTARKSTGSSRKKSTSRAATSRKKTTSRRTTSRRSTAASRRKRAS
jgi:hypothetical protein